MGTHYMAGAWVTKAQTIATELDHASKAPALFRPEHVAQLRKDHANAVRWARYWSAQR